MMVLHGNVQIFVGEDFSIFLFKKKLTPNSVFRVSNCPLKINFLFNKDKYRGKILFTFCLSGTNMEVCSPKGYTTHDEYPPIVYGDFGVATRLKSMSAGYSLIPCWIPHPYVIIIPCLIPSMGGSGTGHIQAVGSGNVVLGTGLCH